MIQCEQHPDQWFRYDDLPLTEAAIEPLAKYLGCKSEDVVFVPNATTGVNSVDFTLFFFARFIFFLFSFCFLWLHFLESLFVVVERR